MVYFKGPGIFLHFQALAASSLSPMGRAQGAAQACLTCRNGGLPTEPLPQGASLLGTPACGSEITGPVLQSLPRCSGARMVGEQLPPPRTVLSQCSRSLVLLSTLEAHSVWERQDRTCPCALGGEQGRQRRGSRKGTRGGLLSGFLSSRIIWLF